MQKVNLGILGGGTVGSGVFHHLENNGALLEARLGIKISLRKIAVRDPNRARAYPIPKSLLTTDWKAVVNDPNVHIVVELAGGTTEARTMILSALKLGKPVVTANKALLCAHGEELLAAARKYQTTIYYEASVAGGIPIIKILREGLAGNRVNQIYGIVNGTCNYILTRMQEEGTDFAPTLAEAQKLGYAEADPGLDVDGGDSQHKICLLASLAHGFWVRPENVFVEGIRHIQRDDIMYAGQLGYIIKLLGQTKSMLGKNNGPIQATVYPALIPRGHVLAGVNHVFNALCIRGDVVGDLFLRGRGAGPDATASAVLSDIADAALDCQFGRRLAPFSLSTEKGEVLPMAEVVSRYYLRVPISKPGVPARVAQVLAEEKIDLTSLSQPAPRPDGKSQLILLTGSASNQAMARALAKIARLPGVPVRPTLIRVEDLS